MRWSTCISLMGTPPMESTSMGSETIVMVVASKKTTQLGTGSPMCLQEDDGTCFEQQVRCAFKSTMELARGSAMYCQEDDGACKRSKANGEEVRCDFKRTLQLARGSPTCLQEEESKWRILLAICLIYRYRHFYFYFLVLHVNSCSYILVLRVNIYV